MYSTCLFCNHALGANESIERFPVGRRLAFDAAKGRLWVVCRACGRWNLSPLEERWESIEACEQHYRDTRLRVATDEIGLARLQDGLELVRIGRPLRPEFAAWRYGDQFGKRRLRTIAIVGGSVAIGGVMLATGTFAFLKAAIPGGGMLYQLPNWINMYRMQRVIAARVQTPDGEKPIKLGQVKQAQLVRRDDAERGWALRVRHADGSALVTGDEAVRVAGLLLARINHSGAFQKTVRSAVDRIEGAGSPESFIARVAPEDPGPPVRKRWKNGDMGGRAPEGAMARLGEVDRLALEMATHEEAERRALEGELAVLEAQWQEAEEIAKIADDLLLPADVDDRVRRLRARAAPGSTDGG